MTVPPDMGSSESSDQPLSEIDSSSGMPLMVGSFNIDDAIAMHLVDCAQCREATERGRPVGIGQKSGHCDAYWQLQLMRANYEGIVNGIGHVTEFGDEAPVQGRLE